MVGISYRFYRMLWILLFSMLFPALYGQNSGVKVYTVDNIPKIHIQDKTRYVCDPEHILSSSVRDSIDHMFYRLEQKNGIETAIVIVPSIGDKDVFDFCHQLLNDWGVGKKGSDNGWVAVMVLDQKRVQFYTGYELEGDLPDAVCKKIQLNDMIPYFKKGDWNTGMLKGMQAVYDRLLNVAPNQKVRENTDSLTVVWIAFAFFVICIIVSVIALRNSKKCPKCNHATLVEYGRILKYRSGKKRIDTVTKECTHCGYRYQTDETYYDDDSSSGGNRRSSNVWNAISLLGLFLGGFGNRNDSNGGGSFGGGSGGGGGAGSNW